jgi:hypothetical protein
MNKRNLVLILAATSAAGACGGGVISPDTDGDVDIDVDADADADADSDSDADADGVRCTGPSDCTAPEECCGSTCVNTRVDPDNCGGCNEPCGPQADGCISGTCSCNGAAACAAPLACCGGDGCVDVESSRDHCGACGAPCEGECQGGVCSGCVPDAHEETGGNACGEALALGDVADTGASQIVTGNLYPDGDQDCFLVNAVDTPDTECDTFHVDIRLTANPSGQYGLQVYRGGCEAAECNTTQYSQYSWATDFYTPAAGEAPPLGECPCRPSPLEGTGTCADNSAAFRFCVVRVSGQAADCAWYEVEVSNGVYGT